MRARFHRHLRRPQFRAGAFLNGAAIGAIQLAMLAKLSCLYGIPFERHRGKSLLTTIGFRAAHSLITQSELSRAVQANLV